ncbi:MAG: family 43 glycosylhydrolase [Candidatus Azobacteroides sp.]|nr:family 43 glycosylhydrolase [Candidatus Azobacteroides sp.]
MKPGYLLLATALSLLCFRNAEAQNDRIIANPIELNYRFQFENPGYREAADPVCEYFKGKYYLFASKSGGYWSSTDLVKWTYIPSKTIGTIENYAPTVLVLNNTLYYMASGEPVKIYKNADPDKDNWKLIDTQFHFPMVGNTDPAFFRDDDGRVYIYWGCSDKDPIIGVEVDPKKGFKTIGEPAVLIEHHSEQYGWEVSGNNNEENKDGWNEGPCMLKHNGKYYLQYAAPGTQFRVYGDGVYVGDNPLGPFRYVERNPFSFKPGGFIGGAGHGHTFKDKYGNYWHIATMKISVRHMFERRLGLFPLHIDEGGNFIQQSVWSDYPFIVPDKKTEENVSAGWNLLSYNQPVAVSSFLPGFFPFYAVDEKIETWWSAETGQPGEWFQVDLRKKPEVRAIQVNFADQDFNIRAPHDLIFYRYVIEASDDGVNWEKIIDKCKNTKDAVHELIVLDKPLETRYLRITNSEELPGKFSLSDFRVFGKGNGDLPDEVADIRAIKNTQDTRKYNISWQRRKEASGYIVSVFSENGTYVTSVMTSDNELRGGFFNRDTNYLFTIDSFNENGITKGTKKVTGTEASRWTR